MEMRKMKIRKKRFLPTVLEVDRLIVTVDGKVAYGAFVIDWNLILLAPGSSWKKFKIFFHEMLHWVVALVNKYEENMWDGMIDGVFKTWYWHWRYKR